MSTKQFYIDSLKELVKRTFPSQPIYDENPEQDVACVASVYMAGFALESFVKIYIRSNAWVSMEGETNYFEFAHDLAPIALQTYDGLLEDWHQDHAWMNAEDLEGQLRRFAENSAKDVISRRLRRERIKALNEILSDAKSAAASKDNVEVTQCGLDCIKVTQSRLFTNPEEVLAYINTLPEKN